MFRIISIALCSAGTVLSLVAALWFADWGFAFFGLLMFALMTALLLAPQPRPPARPRDTVAEELSRRYKDGWY